MKSVKYTEIPKTFMKQRVKKILSWILIIVIIAALGFVYSFHKVAEGSAKLCVEIASCYYTWDLETMVVFCLGALYLVGLAKVLMWMFRK